MTAVTVHLNNDEQAFLLKAGETTVLKWAYHTTLPIEGEEMPVHQIKANIHAIVDPIYEYVGSHTDGYTPYDADERPVTSNEDAIGYTGQFFHRISGRNWTTRTGRTHYYNEGGWEAAHDELFDTDSFDMWDAIVAKVCTARIEAGVAPLFGTHESFVKLATVDAIIEPEDMPIAAQEVELPPEPVDTEATNMEELFARLEAKLSELSKTKKQPSDRAPVAHIEQFAATVTDLCEKAIDSMMDANTTEQEAAVKQALQRAMLSTTELYLATK